jgi:hypothetical protein
MNRLKTVTEADGRLISYHYDDLALTVLEQAGEIRRRRTRNSTK